MRDSSPRRVSSLETVIGSAGSPRAYRSRIASWTSWCAGPVVVGRPDDLDDVGDGVLGQQHAAEDALLGRDVVRRHPLELLAALRQLGKAHSAHPPHA